MRGAGHAALSGSGRAPARPELLRLKPVILRSSRSAALLLRHMRPSSRKCVDTWARAGKFPFIRENNREFCKLEHSRLFAGIKDARVTWGWPKFPVASKPGIFGCEPGILGMATGISRDRTGNFLQPTGNILTPQQCGTLRQNGKTSTYQPSIPSDLGGLKCCAAFGRGSNCASISEPTHFIFAV